MNIIFDKKQIEIAKFCGFKIRYRRCFLL